MAEPLRIVVRRGEVVEAVHRVHAVAVLDGLVVAAAGDPALVTFFRSSAKPLQVLPLVRACPEVSDEEVAIASASHGGSEEQVAVVRRLLARSGSSEEELECGPQEGRPPGRIYHNCSGKHAGMLAVCRARDLPLPGYRLPGHPLKTELTEEIVQAAGVDPALAVDGCGVPTFGLSLTAMARSFSVLAELDGGSRVLAAISRHPELLRGPVGTDVDLMLACPGWVAKGGAEGLLCGRAADGTGFALKVEDGAYRALRPALTRFFPSLERKLETGIPVMNSLGEEVGEVVAA